MSKAKRPKKAKVSAKEKRRTEAQLRALTVELLTARRKLRTLLTKRAVAGSLTEAETIEAERLIDEIEYKKAGIVQLGQTPANAVQKLADEGKAKEKARLASAARQKGTYTSGGIGMYGLGATLKVWT